MVEHVVAGSFSLMKNINTNLILNTIREKGAVSRSEIAKLTRLTPATITNITSELISLGLLVEGERGKSSGGRKPVMLLMNPGRFYILSALITSRLVIVAYTNLNAEVLRYSEKKIDRSQGHEQIMSLLVEMARDFMPDSSGDEKVIGMGIGVHGLVDVAKGISIFAPNLGWREVPIKSIVERQLGIPVFLDNDVKAATLGESWYGLGKNIGNFICLNVDYGVGGGIYLGGKIYRGVSGGAGEVGHTTIEKDGPRCSCGNYGCLQSFVSESAIAERYAGKIGQRDSSAVTTGYVYEAAGRGDPAAREVLKETGEYLGIGVANIINTFNPEVVILTGSIIRGGTILLDAVREEVGSRAMANSSKAAKIVYSELAEKAILKGAAALMLQEVFNNLEIITEKSV